MKLKLLKSVEIVPTSPFDFDSTFHKPDHFTSGDNYWEPGVRWQTWRHLGIPLGLKFINSGSKNTPIITVEIYSKSDLSLRPHLAGVAISDDNGFTDTLVSEIKYRYNLDLDLSDFYKKFESDKVLSPVINKWRGMRPGHPSSLYEYLIIGIVLQNATVRRSIQMFSALLENYGELLEYDDKKLWCFWEAGGLKNVSEEELRALKVGYRAKSIKKIDDAFANGEIDEPTLRKECLDFQRAELLKLYGVGPATVWYLLFDVFHHWDFFNHISPWEQKIYSKLFFDKDPENPVPVDKLLKHFEKYKPYQQLAVHYIWEDLWWTRLRLKTSASGSTKSVFGQTQSAGQGTKNKKNSLVGEID